MRYGAGGRYKSLGLGLRNGGENRKICQRMLHRICIGTCHLLVWIPLEFFREGPWQDAKVAEFAYVDPVDPAVWSTHFSEMEVDDAENRLQYMRGQSLWMMVDPICTCTNSF